MTVKLLDYAGEITNVDIGDIDNIASMHIRVLTGDEVLTVTYKDYSVDHFDSSDCRMEDFFDEEYDVYNINTGVNLLEDKAFMERTTSYWRGW